MAEIEQNNPAGRLYAILSRAKANVETRAGSVTATESHHVEHIVDKAELKQILEDVTELFNEVQQTDIDAELKTFILDGLESIRRGIYEFRIRGPERLKETVGEIVGSLYVNYKTVAVADGDESLETLTSCLTDWPL